MLFPFVCLYNTVWIGTYRVHYFNADRWVRTKIKIMSPSAADYLRRQRNCDLIPYYHYDFPTGRFTIVHTR